MIALFFSGVAALALASTPARAESADQNAQKAAPDNGQALAEIIVTAQRRTENIQKSSLVIQSISGADLATANVNQAKDLNSLVPGLQVDVAGTAAHVFIRGVGDSSSTLASNPGVAFNIDGVYIARPQAFGTSFFDLDRIEVLKGPQGTLYGRNASGGAINIITAKPSFAGVSGNLSLEGGNYGLVHVTGALNVPLTSTLAVRGSFDVVRRDGYLSDGTDDDHHEAARLHILWQPSPDLTSLTTIDYSHVHGNGPGFGLAGLSAGTNPWTAGASPAGLAILAAQAPFGPFLVQNWNGPYISSTGTNISENLSYKFGNATLTLLPAYRDYVDNERNFPGFSNTAYFHDKEFTFEGRINYDNARLKSALGVYYFNDSTVGTTDIAQGIFQLTHAEYPLEKTLAYAVFGQVTYSIVPTFRLIGGLRYTSEHRELSGSLLTMPSVSAPVQSLAPFSGVADFHAVTWKAGAEYDVAPQSMAYATASTGYKAGGLNQEPAPNEYQPEKLTAFEIGLRNRFFNNRVQLNIELFKWNYNNHQEAVITFDNTFSPNYLVENAGAVSLKGFDVDLKAKVTGEDTIHGAVEYNDAYYKSFSLNAAAFAVIPGVSTGCPVGPSSLGPAFTTINCAGFQLARAPKWTGSAGWDHRFDFHDGAELLFSANAQYASSRWAAVDFVPEERLPAYVVFNLDATYTAPSKAWSIGAFMHNVGNRAYASGAQIQNFQPTQVYLSINPPRTYGGRISYKF